MIPLHCPTPKIPTLVHVSGTYLLYKPSYSQFYMQIANYSLPWQQGSVRGQFDDMSLANLENPHVGTSTWAVSPIQAEFQPILCANT